MSERLPSTTPLNDYRLISADSHVNEPPDLWTKRVSESLRDRAPRIERFDEGDAWDDPAVWIKANPNLGISVKLDDLERKCAKAQRTAAAQSAFKRKHLNVWTSAHSPWMPMEKWDACADGFVHGPQG